jgi:ubiquinone biosynthesis protein
VLSGFFHLLRLARAGFVFAREGVLALIDPVLLPPGPRFLVRIGRLFERRNAGRGSVRLARALARLGPSYVKLGQFLATRPDVVGAVIASDLESLQDRMPPFSQKLSEAAIVEGLGKPVSELFASLGPPVAAASIAQVHRAEIKDDKGTRAVAVKVLRPGVEYRFQSDLDTFFFAARLGERHSAEARRLRLISTVDTLARSVAIEMDLRLEAAAFSELAQNTKDDPDFRVPAVDWARTAKRILTVEWVEGISLNDRTKLAAAGFDFKQLARVVIQSFLRQALRDGFFHADMHPGNLFVDKNGDLVAVDCGIMGRLGPKERRFLAEILYGFIVGDWRRTAEVHFEAGYVPSHHSVDDFAQAIRAIGEPIRERPASEISMAKLLTLLFEVTAIFEMKTRPELLLLQKTMVVVEGVARALDPGFDMWATADPVVREWMERNLGPVGRLESAAQELGSLTRLVGTAPSLLSRAAETFQRLDEQTKGGLVLSPETVEAIGESKRRGRGWATTALWLIALLIAIWLFR